MLTNGNARDFIAKCLFGKNWEAYKEYVIPRKGNFLNPQYKTDTDTYAVYSIDDRRKRLVNFGTTVITDENGVTTHYATMKMKLNIQFVGKQAEEWACSTLFWDERTDVQEVFDAYNAELLLGDSTSRSIITVPFNQDGYNGEMSYLASLFFIQNVTVEEINELWTDPVVFLGSLKVEK